MIEKEVIDLLSDKYDLKYTFLMRFFPTYLEQKILRSANQPIKATKLNENIW